MSRRTEYRPIVIDGWRDQRQSGDGGTAGYRKGIDGGSVILSKDGNPGFIDGWDTL